jgi:hypothetical protein
LKEKEKRIEQRRSGPPYLSLLRNEENGPPFSSPAIIKMPNPNPLLRAKEPLLVHVLGVLALSRDHQPVLRHQLELREMENNNGYWIDYRDKNSQMGWKNPGREKKVKGFDTTGLKVVSSDPIQQEEEIT